MGDPWGRPVVTLTGSPSYPSTLIMTLRSLMKLSVHLTRFSSSPALLIFRSRHPLATLGKAAAMSMRRAPTMQPHPHASWTWAIVAPTASTADLPALHQYCPGQKPLTAKRGRVRGCDKSKRCQSNPLQKVAESDRV